MQYCARYFKIITLSLIQLSWRLGCWCVREALNRVLTHWGRNFTALTRRGWGGHIWDRRVSLIKLFIRCIKRMLLNVKAGDACRIRDRWRTQGVSITPRREALLALLISLKDSILEYISCWIVFVVDIARERSFWLRWLSFLHFIWFNLDNLAKVLIIKVNII